MVDLRATYRVQFRDGMTFDKAVEIVAYLKRLGISHLYASPIFTAVTGSTHGYDVADHNEIDPAVGGADGFDRLVEALRDEGMGVILDIVPNHMAASLENPWWRSVVEHGSESPFAAYFDMDWGERLTLPVLGREYADVLAAGELKLQADPKNGCLTLAYFDNPVPLQPSTYRMLAERLADEDLAGLADLGVGAAADDSSFHDAVKVLLHGERGPGLAPALDELSRDLTFIDRIHEAQPWRLIFWKEARRHLSYRRFFEVTGLVGVRVEDPAVFDAVHRLTLELVRSGKVDGLRIDHVDGLASPTAYLRRLREEVGPHVPIFVEKILGEGERLPAEWPVDGTTGYEFISAVADLLVDGAGARELEREHSRFVGHETPVGDDVREAKLLILRRNFEGELATLTAMAHELAQLGGKGAERQAIEDALVEVIVAFPVYRTYFEAGTPTPGDRAIVSKVIQTAVQSGRADPGLVTMAVDILCGKSAGSAAELELAGRFVTKFQQLTGPVMAKAVEDTLFYRRNAFIALNEVGSPPGVRKGDVLNFHRAMQQNVGRPPGLLATATHDTKRGEDARARLYALAEQPRIWSEAVARWTSINALHRQVVGGAPAPEREVEWLLYQSLAGLWPPGLDPQDQAGLERLAARFLPYVEKALREAKRRSDWLEIDGDYERAVSGYAAAMLRPANRTFLDDFARTLLPFIEAGAINTVSQTLAKLTAPGIPDFYQGSEGWDFSLVDPDNRRPVEFSALAERLDGPDPAGRAESGFKLHMIQQCLACRRELPDLFAKGSYSPLQVSGPLREHYAAFLRQAEEDVALVVLPRFPLRARTVAANAASFEETCVHLPDFCEGAEFTSVLAGEDFAAGPCTPLQVVLRDRPVALATSRIQD